MRDSAGVKIIENATPLLSGASAPRLASAPFLELDPTQSVEYAFGGVSGVLRLSRGRVLVAARTAPQFRLFDAKGRLLRTANERGMEGKANTDRHSIYKIRGDTIAVVHTFYVTLFVVRGDSLMQIGLPPEPPSERPSTILVSMLSNGGSAHLNFPSPQTHADGVQWVDSSGLSLRDRDGALIRDLGKVPYLTFEMSPTEKQPTPVWLSDIGVSCAGAGRVYYGFGNAYAIHQYSDRGVLESIIRRAWTPTPVTGADWEHWVVEWSKLWVREAHLDDAITAGSLSDVPVVPSTWSVFNPSGRWLNDLVMPAGFQPSDIGADFVAGRLRKGPDRMAVVVYRLSANKR